MNARCYAWLAAASTSFGCFGPVVQTRSMTRSSDDGHAERRHVVALSTTCADATAGLVLSDAQPAREDVCASGEIARAVDQQLRLSLEHRGIRLSDASSLLTRAGTRVEQSQRQDTTQGSSWTFTDTRVTSPFEAAPFEVQQKLMTEGGMDATLQAHVLVRPMYLLADVPPAVEVAIVMKPAASQGVLWSARCHQENSDDVVAAVRCAVSNLRWSP